MPFSFSRLLLLLSINVLLFCGATPLVAARHPFYVSVTEMNYNSKSSSLEISCKMFAEDVEDVLEQNYKRTVDLANNKQLAQNTNLIKDYASKHMSLTINSKPVTLTFIGFENEKGSIYCYLEVPGITAINQLAIKNSVLYDYKEEQINIVHVTVNGNRKSTKLDYPQSVANFNF